MKAFGKVLKRQALLFAVLLFTNSNYCFGQAGMLDSTFSNDGIDTSYFSGVSLSQFGNSMAIQPDDKIIFAGYLEGFWGLMRYTIDGTLDSTFGTNGKSTIQVGNYYNTYESLAKVAITSNKKIIIGGSSFVTGNNAIALAQLDSTGMIDSSFGTNGITINHLGNGFDDANVFAMAVQPDGKIIVAGGLFYAFGGSDFLVARYDSIGSIDTTFGVNGFFINSQDTNNAFTSMKLLSNGKIILGGYGFTNGSSYSDFELMRLNTNGTIDSTFGNYGIVIDDLGDQDYIMAITIQTDGKIVAGGAKVTGSNNGNFALTRYDSLGVADNSFGSNSRVFTNFGNFTEIHSLLVQPDNKIIAAGTKGNYYSSAFVLARYNSNGILDNSFGSVGKITTTISSSHNYCWDVALQNDGKILAAGDFNFGISDSKYVIVRYLNNLNVGTLTFTTQPATTLVYPNPITSHTTLEYSLPSDEHLSITFFDIQGRAVKTFIKNQLRKAGNHKEQLAFDNSTAAGNYVLNIENAQADSPLGVRGNTSIGNGSNNNFRGKIAVKLIKN